MSAAVMPERHIFDTLREWSKMEGTTMDFRLTEQEQMSRHAARNFAEEETARTVPEMGRTNAFPEHLAQRMQQLGFFGLPYAADIGGSGGTYSILGIVVEELARVSLSLGGYRERPPPGDGSDLSLWH